MIGITGATGALASLILDHLAPRSDVSIRLLARNTDKAESLYRSKSPKGTFDSRYCDYGDVEACQRALGGVETLLFVSAAEHPDRRRQHREFIDAIASAGVQNVIYTSFYRAAPDATFHHARDHYETEEYIKSKPGLQYVFLRNAFYQDILPFFVTDGAIRGPAGHGKFSPVARRDIAAVIAIILPDVTSHLGKTYDLTGPEEVTYAQVAEVLGAEYVDETMEEAWVSRRAPGVENWLIDAWISTYTAARDGEHAGVSDSVERITGKKGTKLGKWVLELSAERGA